MSQMTDPSSALQRLHAGVAECLLRDRRVLRERLRRVEQLLRQGRPASRLIDQITADVEQSRQRRRQRELARPLATFPTDLPVVARREEIARAISDNQVIVLCGETGSGKTTQLPKICLELGRGVDGMIGHTQPRRIAARSVAARIAQELNTNVGAAVGYKVRFGDRTNPDTFIKLMTDGILLAETQGDRWLEQYDTLIIDEAHERSLNIDFLLGYIKQLLPRRPDLKVIVTSATIDPQRFSNHFGAAPIIEVSGRTYPVELRYRPLKSDDPEEEDREQTLGIIEALDELARHGPGDVLVFLSGEREIRETAEELRKHHPPGTEILPLYARLSGDEQAKIFQPHTRRRIVLATNVAETSLTVPGIKYVIDPGAARISRYSPRTKVQRLPIEPVSRASADQRKGRCGRLSEGVCIRLYAQEDFEKRPLFTEPEILRTNLAAVILQMTALRLGDIDKFPFVEPPDKRLIRDGYLTLHELGAVDEENELTAIGRQLARLPVDPRLGRMILAAERENCLSEVLIIASALSIQDPRERPMEMAEVADEAHEQFVDESSDFLGFLKMWDFFREKSKHLSKSQLRKQCKQQFLSYIRMREWHDVHQQLHALVTEMGWRLNRSAAHPDSIHRALLTGLLANVGNKTEKAEYAGPRGAKFFLFPGSALFDQKPAWVMAAELVETTKLYARTVAKVTPQWIERAAAHLIKKTYTDPQWDARRADVIAGEKVTLRGLVIVPHRTVSYGPIDPRTSREVFIHHALVEGEYRTNGEFFKHNQSLVSQVRLLEAKARRRDLLAEPQQRFAFYSARVPADVYNGILFERWRKQAEKENLRQLCMSISDAARPEATEVRPELFPDQFEISNLRFALTYVYDAGRADDGVTATVPLALLNQVPPGPFEWLVPGMLEEKVTELIRSLPKAIRTKLVPAPEFAGKAIFALAPSPGTPGEGRGGGRPVGPPFRTTEASQITPPPQPSPGVPGEGVRRTPFLETVAHQLGKLIGEVIPKAAFDVEQLPSYLRMNFRIVDEAGKTVAMGRDLQAIRSKLGIKARESFAALPPAEFTRDRLTHWDFGDLPERIEIHRDGATFSGFPALVDRGSSVALRVLDSREASKQANRGGVRRLFMLQLDQEMRQLARGLTGIEEMSRHYKPLGTWPELKEQLLSAAVDRALYSEIDEIRTREMFITVADDGWRRLSVTARELNDMAREILARYGQIATALSRDFPPMLVEPIREMRQQLTDLVGKHFLQATPPQWLGHLPRYLRAMSVRLEKLMNAGLMRDRQVADEIRPLWQRYVDCRIAHRTKGIVDEPQLQTLRWMIEELRVSLFAQELKTVAPVSVQRLSRQLEQIAT
jgi:ATP-dependent helicase HrpA